MLVNIIKVGDQSSGYHGIKTYDIQYSQTTIFKLTKFLVLLLELIINLLELISDI